MTRYSMPEQHLVEHAQVKARTAAASKFDHLYSCFRSATTMPRQRAAAPRPKPAPAARPAPAAHAQPQPQHHAPPPAPAAHAPPPAMPQQSSGGGFLSGLMGSVAQGAALGTGSALAHRAVDAVMGPRGGSSEPAAAPAAAPEPMAMPAAPAAAEGPCAQQAKAFAECMSRANGEMSQCQFYFEAMQQCKLGQPFA